MRLFKSAAFKRLDGDRAADMAALFVRWMEARNEPLSHAALNHYLGGFLGFATAQALSFGDLKPEEQPELRAIYETAATMIAVENAASGPVVTSEEFDRIVGEAQATLIGFGMNPVNALSSFCLRNQKAMGTSIETMFGALGQPIREIKGYWPGGDAFERPAGV